MTRILNSAPGYDVVVIGGGPAGMAAALEAHEAGARVALVERNEHLGGILRQCIHPGFGLTYFKTELTGPEYAQRFIDLVERADIDVLLNSMVLAIDEDARPDGDAVSAPSAIRCGQTASRHTVIVMSRDGMRILTTRSVVLAMGCRERTRSEIKIPGSRPAGVFTAGLAQRYINTENLRPCHRAVILGSGDIGLIMARRCALEGIGVEGVYEIMPQVSGLARNVKNCLDDFGIPLHLSTTVTRVIGRCRVEAVEVSRVDENLSPVPGTERLIPCDALLLSVGLIPENELSVAAGVRLDPRTRGAAVDACLQTSVPGIFSCGNVLHVHELADNVTVEAKRAGRAAAIFAHEGNAGLAKLAAEFSSCEPSANEAPEVRRERRAAAEPSAADAPLAPDAGELPPNQELQRLSCTTCPKGCSLIAVVEQDAVRNRLSVPQVYGNRCRRGEAFARQEITCPARILTSTVALQNGDERLLPVRTARPIALSLHRDAMNLLNAIVAEAPLTMGDVVVPNILNTGIDVIASMDANIACTNLEA